MKEFNINAYDINTCMHCKTEEEARDFCNYLHSLGKKWCTGRSYAENILFEKYGKNTVYYFTKDEFADLEYARMVSSKILKWSDFMKKKFTKADLKTGDVIKRRNGDVEIFNLELGMFIRIDGGWNDLNYINDDLSNLAYKDYDIIAVRRPITKSDCSFCAFANNYGNLVYERKEVEEMTLEEVCRLLGKEIKIVKSK